MSDKFQSEKSSSQSRSRTESVNESRNDIGHNEEGELEIKQVYNL